MKNKKKLCFLPAIFLMMIFLCTPSFATQYAGKSVAVIEPTMQNSGQEENWISLFVQGQLTTNMQNYSDMVIVDRQNIDKVIKEQKLSISAAYAEENQIKIGELLSAEYLVIINILKKTNSFAINAKITDSQTSQIIASYGNPDCPASELESGLEINRISYGLLSGIKVSENLIAVLLDTTKFEKQQNEIAANANTAKGIAVEKSGGSIVEAMAYYQKAIGDASNMTEAATRFTNMTTSLSNGNIRDKVLNQIMLRDEWVKIWTDFANYANDNCPYVVYSKNIERGKIDYEKETVEIKMNVAYKANPVVTNLYVSLMAAYKALAAKGNDVRNWNITVPDGNKTKEIEFRDYTTSFGISYIIQMEIKAADGETLGSEYKYAGISIVDTDSREKIAYDIRPKEMDSFLNKNSGFTAFTMTFSVPVSKVKNLSAVVTTNKKGGVIYATN